MSPGLCFFFFFKADLPGTAPRCLRMDPELFGRTVRFHPCLRNTWLLFRIPLLRIYPECTGSFTGHLL